MQYDPETKNCQNCKNNFVIESEDFSFYEKIKVPPPTFCPECRMIRRTSFRNVRSLYRRPCDLCKQNTINMYHNDDVCPVYCNDCYLSDLWDGLNYGAEIDWSKTFLLQWYELFKKVPRYALMKSLLSTNCDFVNYEVSNKNCYLVYSALHSQDSKYSENIYKVYFCFDCLYLSDSENCYENLDCTKNYNSNYIIKSRACLDSWFLIDCVNCNNCFMSSNLRNKQYVFRNKQLKKEEYLEEISKINTKSFSVLSQLKIEFEQLCQKSIHKYADIVSSVDVTGNNIANSKNVSFSFGVDASENIKNGIRIAKGVKDIMDCYGLTETERIYDSFTCSLQSSDSKFSFLCLNSSNIQYSAFCSNSNNLFGCVGLKKASYCILNKQYSKEEYEILVPKIIDHMMNMPYIDKKNRTYRYGEFFPIEFSPFCLNETIAFDLYQPSKEKSINQGYKWKDPENKEYQTTYKAINLPDSLDDIDESITKEIIECMHSQNCEHQCTKAFRVLEDELVFYKKRNLPIPRLCPNCRHYERLSKREPVKLWHRKCMKEGCNNEFETSYAPERPEIVYCEKCYQGEVY